MLKKHIFGAALLGAVAFGPVSATAATASFDFAAMADVYKAANAGQEGSWDQVTGGSVTDNGITITDAKGTWAGDPLGDLTHAFFDGTDGSGPAGLGVCHSGWNGSLSECSSNGGAFPGDDNIGMGEALTLIFDRAVWITDLLLRDAGHQLLDGTVSINGSVYTVVAGMIDSWDLKSIGTVDTFTFAYDDGEIYLSKMGVDDDPNNNPAPVPLPAGGVLLLGGLAGLAGLKRRRRKA